MLLRFLLFCLVALYDVIMVDTAGVGINQPYQLTEEGGEGKKGGEEVGGGRKNTTF